MVRPAIALLLTFPALLAQGPFEARITAAEAVVARHYRGESLEVARQRLQRDLEAFNAAVKTRAAEAEATRLRTEQALAPAREAHARLQAMDLELKDIPDGNDAPANARFQEKIKVRNALAQQVRDLNRQAEAAVSAAQAEAERAREGGIRERERVLAAQSALEERSRAFQTFAKEGQDLAFFSTLNRLLVDLRKARAPEADLARVRTLRRDLGRRVTEELKTQGLVVVEARAGDEPVWLLVDTSAVDSVLNQELAEAAGGSPGEDTHSVLLSGLRFRAKALRLPSLGIATQVRADVPAAVLPPALVGLDGLLGQSFLAAFTLTLDGGALRLQTR